MIREKLNEIYSAVLNTGLKFGIDPQIIQMDGNLYLYDPSVFQYKQTDRGAYIDCLNISKTMQYLQGDFDSSIVKFRTVTSMAEKRLLAYDINGLIVPDEVMSEKTGEILKVVGLFEHAFDVRNRIYIGNILHNVILGKNIDDIHKNAFMMSRVKNLDLSRTKVHMIPGSCFENSEICSVKLNNTIERIHDEAFSKCTHLSEIIGNITIDTIGRYAFAECYELKEINFKPVHILGHAFNNCYRLEKINLSETQGVGIGAFKCCNSLHKIQFSDKLYKIAGRAFYSTGLTDVYLGNGVQYIEEYAFGNSPIISIDLPRSLVRCDSPFDSADNTRPYGLSDNLAAINGRTLNIGVYKGTIGHSYCKGSNLPYHLIGAGDEVVEDKSNVSKKIGRIKLVGGSVFDQMCTDVDAMEHHNPTFDEIKDTNYEYRYAQGKLLNLQMNDAVKRFLDIQLPERPDVIETAQFKFMVDLMCLASPKPFVIPFTTQVFRALDRFSKLLNVIYTDGYNKIIRVEMFDLKYCTYCSYVVAVSGDKLVYIADMCNLLKVTTSINKKNENKIYSFIYKGKVLPTEYIQNGLSTYNYSYKMHGENIDNGDRQERVRRSQIATKLHGALSCCSVHIPLRNKYLLYVVPEKDFCAVCTVYEASGDAKVVQEVHDLAYAFTVLKQLQTTPTTSSSEVFNEVHDLSDTAINNDIADIFKRKAPIKSKMHELAQTIYNNVSGGPNKLIISCAVNSYWVDKKNKEWFESLNKKSLNFKNSTTVDGLYIQEYVSNQIIKINKLFTSGCKGAYVYVIKDTQNGKEYYYTSRYKLDKVIQTLSKAYMDSLRQYYNSYTLLATTTSDYDTIAQRQSTRKGFNGTGLAIGLDFNDGGFYLLYLDRKVYRKLAKIGDIRRAMTLFKTIAECDNTCEMSNILKDVNISGVQYDKKYNSVNISRACSTKYYRSLAPDKVHMIERVLQSIIADDSLDPKVETKEEYLTSQLPYRIQDKNRKIAAKTSRVKRVTQKQVEYIEDEEEDDDTPEIEIELNTDEDTEELEEEEEELDEDEEELEEDDTDVIDIDTNSASFKKFKQLAKGYGVTDIEKVKKLYIDVLTKMNNN